MYLLPYFVMNVALLRTANLYYLVNILCAYKIIKTSGYTCDFGAL